MILNNLYHFLQRNIKILRMHPTHAVFVVSKDEISKENEKDLMMAELIYLCHYLMLSFFYRILYTCFRKSKIFFLSQPFSNTIPFHTYFIPVSFRNPC